MSAASRSRLYSPIHGDRPCPHTSTAYTLLRPRCSTRPQKSFEELVRPGRQTMGWIVGRSLLLRDDLAEDEQDGGAENAADDSRTGRFEAPTA